MYSFHFKDTDLPDVVKIHRKLLKYPEIVKPGAYNDIIDIQIVLFPTYLQPLVCQLHSSECAISILSTVRH